MPKSICRLSRYLLYGLLRGKPFRSINEIIANHIESPGTKAFTKCTAAQLFPGLVSQRIRIIVTRYDVRIGRNRFLPQWFTHLVPYQLGWNLIIEGKCP